MPLGNVGKVAAVWGDIDLVMPCGVRQTDVARAVESAPVQLEFHVIVSAAGEVPDGVGRFVDAHNPSGFEGVPGDLDRGTTLEVMPHEIAPAGAVRHRAA